MGRGGAVNGVAMDGARGHNEWRGTGGTVGIGFAADIGIRGVGYTVRQRCEAAVCGR